MAWQLLAMAGLSLAGTLAQGGAAKAAGERDQHIAEYNARMGEIDAVRIRKAGVQRENDLRQSVARLASRQRAAFGASGVVVNSGSAAAVQRDTFTMGEVDAMRIRQSVEDQATAVEEGAMLTRMDGRARARAGSNAFRTSVLTGGAQFAKSAYGALK